MTVKVFKLSDDRPNNVFKSVFETNRCVNFIVKDGFFIIEVGSGFFQKFSTKLYGCYVVA